MVIKTSFSQNSTYIKCPKHWYWRYVEKLDSEYEGSSIYFGTAVDKAVMAMLQGNKNYLMTFNDQWFSTNNLKKEVIQIYDNPKIMYSHADFDKDVLLPEDIKSMDNWQQELLLEKIDPISLFQKIQKNKKNPYKKTTLKQIQYFNRCSWLSLKRKGELLLKLFEKNFYPKIKEVISIQKFHTISDQVTGDSIIGALDFIVRMDGYDSPVVLDLKTASKPYTQEDIELSEQLPLYLSFIQNKFNWQTNLVGYIVLVKKINKKTLAFCKNCGFEKNSKHQTCNNEINGGRCGGEWEEKIELDPQMQVIIEEKSQQDINNILEDYSNIIDAMKRKIIYKDRSKCYNWYGNKCPYFNACHKNDLTGLRKR